MLINSINICYVWIVFCVIIIDVRVILEKFILKIIYNTLVYI